MEKALGVVATAAFAILTFVFAHAMDDDPLFLQYLLGGLSAFMVVAFSINLVLVVSETRRRLRKGNFIDGLFSPFGDLDRFEPADPPPDGGISRALSNVALRMFGLLLLGAGVLGAIVGVAGAMDAVGTIFLLALGGLGVALLVARPYTLDGKPGSWLTGAPRKR